MRVVVVGAGGSLDNCVCQPPTFTLTDLGMVYKPSGPTGSKEMSGKGRLWGKKEFFY